MKILIFFTFLGIFLVSNGGHLDAWDGQGYFLLTESLVLNQNFKLYYDSPSIKELEMPIESYYKWQFDIRNPNESIPENPPPIYTWASPLLSFLAVPFYLIAEKINFSPIIFSAYFLNSIILAFSVTLVYAFSNELYNSKKIALILSLVAGICSFAWPYASSFFQQPLAGLMIIAASYFLFMASRNKIKGSSIYAGLFTGLIILAHSGTIIVIPGILVICVYIFRNDIKKIFWFFVGIFPVILFQAYFNWLRFNSIFDFGYGALQEAQNHTSTYGIYGMIFSPGFGLLVNFPLFVLFPISLYFLWKKNKTISVMFGYFFISTWLFFGTQQDPFWSGFGGWGPRYLVPIIPIIAVSLGILLKEFQTEKYLKIIFTGLASIGFLVNLLGILVWYTIGYGYGWSIQRLLEYPKFEVFYFQWSLQSIPVVLHWNVLVTDFWKTLESPYFGWKPCIPDNFIYCNFGLLPIIISVIIIIILVIFTFKKIVNKENNVSKNKIMRNHDE
jgi:hypothetical protein